MGSRANSRIATREDSELASPAATTHQCREHKCREAPSRGRPKQLPKSCLSRSPPKAAAQAPALLDVSIEVLHFAPGVKAPAREVPQLLPCTSCQEAGKQAVSIVYCVTCTDHMCQEYKHTRSSELQKIMLLLKLYNIRLYAI